MRTTPDARVCFIPDPDDQPEIDAIEASWWRDPVHAQGLTTQGRSILAVRMTKEPLIFLGADDLIPSEGWLEKALAHMHDGDRGRRRQ